jgi:hypothetical protein
VRPQCARRGASSWLARAHPSSSSLLLRLAATPCSTETETGFWLAIGAVGLSLTLSVALVMKARNLFQYLAKLRAAIASAGDAPAPAEAKALVKPPAK